MEQNRHEIRLEVLGACWQAEVLAMDVPRAAPSRPSEQANEFRRIGNIYPPRGPFGVGEVTALVVTALIGPRLRQQRKESTVRGEKTADSRALRL